MSDNLPAPTSPNWVAEWLSNGKIPGAAKAIAQLIGSTANAGAAWINIATVKGQQIQQAIKNDTDALTVVSKALAKAAAKQGIEDTALVERAVEQWAGARLKSQSNRESIAEKTIRQLEETNNKISDSPPDDEWMDIFGGYAEKASKEKLQETWARVLAGEIRKPGTFSYTTLHMISTIDALIAAELEHFSPLISEDNAIYEPSRFDWTSDFGRIGTLKEFGLFSTDVSQRYIFNDEGYIARRFSGFCLIIRGEPKATLALTILPLSRSGREIFCILTPAVDIESLRATAQLLLKNSDVNSVDICKVTGEAGDQYNLEKLEEMKKQP